jgi:hypothetical protein
MCFNLRRWVLGNKDISTLGTRCSWQIVVAPAAPNCPGRVARLFAVVRSRRAGGLASHLPTRFGGFAGYLLQSLARVVSLPVLGARR